MYLFFDDIIYFYFFQKLPKNSENVYQNYWKPCKHYIFIGTLLGTLFIFNKLVSYIEIIIRFAKGVVGGIHIKGLHCPFPYFYFYSVVKTVIWLKKII